MKKLLSAVLAAALIFCLCACSGGETVTITVPVSYGGAELTQQSLDKMAKEMGWASATLNADGTATYSMSEKKHSTLVEEIRNTIDAELAVMPGSDYLPNLVSVTHNEDYTHFELVTKSEALDTIELLYLYTFYDFGATYAAFSGDEPKPVTVRYINEASGEVLLETASDKE